ncbi:hypothetical protein [Pseudomonas sp. FP2338]|uniref:hypothetical protein n=1 Tax=Pseudomonas sp. FP2338 TaxID=2954093 RepID=UPI00273246C4|nr:hypothetical protein [Pseudomonas sp. FP2338]WLH82459.1 hypothetical protein PSH96_16595 [Pseudomonas sp. FP2338]
MNKYLLCSLLALVAGCSTGPYLHPESSVGQNAVLSRTCPGAHAAMSFTAQPEKLNWVRVLVYVAPPGTRSWPGNVKSTDTELRLFGRLYKPSQGYTKTPLWVSAASPEVSVQLASGRTYRVSVEQLKTGFDPAQISSSDTQGTPLGKGDMDDFTLTFPDIFVNEEKVPMAPIHFKKREEHYAPVFNC